MKHTRGLVSYKAVAREVDNPNICICDKVTGRPIGKIAQKLSLYLGINARHCDIFPVDTFWNEGHRHVDEKVVIQILVRVFSYIIQFKFCYNLISIYFFAG